MDESDVDSDDESHQNVQVIKLSKLSKCNEIMDKSMLFSINRVRMDKVKWVQIEYIISNQLEIILFSGKLKNDKISKMCLFLNFLRSAIKIKNKTFYNASF